VRPVESSEHRVQFGLVPLLHRLDRFGGFALDLHNHLLQQRGIIGKIECCRVVHDARSDITPGMWSASG
jgi:hypothetical protein